MIGLAVDGIFPRHLQQLEERPRYILKAQLPLRFVDVDIFGHAIAF